MDGAKKIKITSKLIKDFLESPVHSSFEKSNLSVNVREVVTDASKVAQQVKATHKLKQHKKAN